MRAPSLCNIRKELIRNFSLNGYNIAYFLAIVKYF